MTRDEEIITACKGFLSRYPSIDQAGLSIGFLDGAVWADKHPVNVWHDASECPQEDKYVLFQDEENDCDIVLTRSADEWNTWCNTCKVIRWANISDLLPKGGIK